MKQLMTISALSALLAAASACLIVREPRIHGHATTSVVEYESAATSTAEVSVQVAPPVNVVEVESACPGPDYVWGAGYHRWDGRTYIWMPGCWMHRPTHVHARAGWVAPHWERRGHVHVWVAGCWR